MTAPANAAATDVAEAEGQLVTGGGAININGAAELDPAYSATPSGTSPVSHPVDLTALSALNLKLGSGLFLGGTNPVLQLGVGGQYAKTGTNGTAFASSGAITSDGSIDSGAANDSSADTELNLTPLLTQSAVSSALVDKLEVDLGAVSATATGTSGSSKGAYQIAGGKIVAHSPAVANVDSTLTTTLKRLTGTLNTALGQAGLVDSLTGPLTKALNDLNLGGLISLSGTTATASLTTADLSNVLTSAGTAQSTDKAVTISLASGTVSIDLSKAFGGSLNGLPANTDLLTSSKVQKLLASDLTQAVTNLVTQVTNAAQDELYSETVTVDIASNVALGGLPVADITGTISGPLGGFLQAPGYDAPDVSSTASLIGVVDLSGLTGALTTDVLPAVLTAVGDVVNPLLATDLTGTVSSLGSTLGTDLDGLLGALNQVVDLTANVQEKPGTFTTSGAGQAAFTERALQVKLVPALGPLATLSLASASVRSTVPGAPIIAQLNPDRGPENGGQTVTITGKNLCNATHVTFGGYTYYLEGSAAAIAHPGQQTFRQGAAPDCDISLLTQAGKGTVQVTVTTPIGTSNSMPYTYVPAATTVKRLEGPQRYETAIAISKETYPVAGSAKTVFVANSATFPDALAAGPAAERLNGPVLVTPATQLLSDVKAEITRLAPQQIVVVGGTGAISTPVAQALGKIAPTTRVSGADRYATSIAVAKYAFGSKMPKAFIATGVDYADALSASAYAASQHEPVLLVPGNMSTAPSSLTSLLKKDGTTSVSIAGGTGAVSSGIVASLKKADGVSVTRFGGANRYETSQLINAQFKTAPAIYLARADLFPDALTGASAAGRLDAPLYVIPYTCVPQAVKSAITSYKAGTVYVLGGWAALSKPAIDKLTVCTS